MPVDAHEHLAQHQFLADWTLNVLKEERFGPFKKGKSLALFAQFLGAVIVHDNQGISVNTVK